MKRLFAPTLCLVAALSAAAVTPAPQDVDLVTRVKALEDELVGLRATVTTLQTAQGDAQAATQNFFVAQTRAVKALGDALKSAQDDGFGAGMNPRAHQTLLDGLRTYGASLDAAVPGDAKKKAAEKTPKDGAGTSSK
jgi:hypothetical protein